MTPLYIFDLDGTIALIEHRRHFVEARRCLDAGCHGKGCELCDGSGWRKPNWRAFFAACVDDLPNLPVIDTLMSLLDAGADVWVWSGRSAEVMEQTKTWLQDHLIADDIPLCMRLEGDFTPDEELKAGWLDAMSAYDRRRLVAVFDDRNKVVAMWRSRGVACFQVALGEF